ncbi:MAG: hypothetical protein ACRCYV_04285 [Aeromonas sp.]
MFALLKWLFIVWALLLATCEWHISTSLYKVADNRVEVRFPRWQAHAPWARLTWQGGQALEVKWLGWKR